MSHFIDKFTVERRGNHFRLSVGDRTLLLGRDEAQQLADALESGHNAELVFSGETGEHMIVTVESGATGDRWFSVSVRTPLLGVQAKQVANALKE